VSSFPKPWLENICGIALLHIPYEAK